MMQCPCYQPRRQHDGSAAAMEPSQVVQSPGPFHRRPGARLLFQLAVEGRVHAAAAPVDGLVQGVGHPMSMA